MPEDVVVIVVGIWGAKSVNTENPSFKSQGKPGNKSCDLKLTMFLTFYIAAAILATIETEKKATTCVDFALVSPRGRCYESDKSLCVEQTGVPEKGPPAYCHEQGNSQQSKSPEVIVPLVVTIKPRTNQSYCVCSISVDTATAYVHMSYSESISLCLQST